MPIRVQVGLRDCGHWTAPFQDAINFATLQAQAADCRSCASVIDWVLTMHASRCDGETDYMAVMDAFRRNREWSWRAILHRLRLSCVRGAWFTRKFVQDLSLTLLLCGVIAISVSSVPVFAGISIGVVAGIVALATVCCCGCGTWLKKILRFIMYGLLGGFTAGVAAVIGACWLTYKSILRMLGANFGRGEGRVAPPAWTELDDGGYGYARVLDIESGRSDDMELPITQLSRESIELAHAPWLQLPQGSSCVRISSASSPGSPGLGCNIYRHTYNPRGPIGSFVYLVPGIGQRENHPTNFLSLAAGKLFLAAWPREQARWDIMRSRVGSSLAKSQGQEYDQIASFTTKPDPSSGIVGAPLPTRLLDLGEGGFSVENLTVSALRSKLSTSRLKLITTPPDARGRYLTLSHRWGDDEQFKLTKSSLPSFQLDGIPFSTIPKTFQDAIVATRLLRHRYLWIDALCIVQDDPDDWAQESARMAAVYSNASCTISAHTARNSDAGFLDASLEPPPTLVLRSPRYFFNPRRTITHLTLLGSFADQVAGSFLSRRGWVFQERVLSRRLLHFVQHHTFFEDAAGVLADDVVSANMPPLHRLEDNKWSVTDSFHGFVYWYRLVQKYSKCSLTYKKDRLPAIAGLAQSFSAMNDPGMYRFGLWERSIHMGLLWINDSGRPIERDGDVEAEVKEKGADRLTLTSRVSVEGTSNTDVGSGEPQAVKDDQSSPTVTNNDGDGEADKTDIGNGTRHVEATLPSWSWVSCQGAVIYPETVSDSMRSDLVLLGDRSESNAVQPGIFHVDNARVLMVEGLVVHLTLVLAKVNSTQQGMPFFDPPIQGLYSIISGGNQFGSWVSLDQHATSGSVVSPKLSCLRVCSLREVENTFVLRYETTFYFLLLEEVGASNSGRYRRVGVGVTSKDYWAEVERTRVEII